MSETPDEHVDLVELADTVNAALGQPPRASYHLSAYPLPDETAPGWIAEVDGGNSLAHLGLNGARLWGADCDEILREARTMIAWIAGVPDDSFSLVLQVMREGQHPNTTVGQHDQVRRAPASSGPLGQSYCYLHGWESVWPDSYRVCRECQHVYCSAEELLLTHANEVNMINAHHNDGDVALPLAADADEISYCPLCSHDW